MSKIIINNTNADVTIIDVGIQILALGTYTINPTDYDLFASSDNSVSLIGDGTLTINDGSVNLSISDGVDLIKGIFPSEITLRGGTDNTNIGNIGDSLKVTSEGGDFKISPVPLNNVIYKDTRLLNGTSKKMDVNGSSTPVNFDYIVPSADTIYLTQITLFIIDPGSADYNDFGAIGGGLSNGVQILIKSNGVEYQETNLKDNADIVQCFGGGVIVPTGSGFIDEDDIYFGTLTFKVPITLNGSLGDYVRFKIRDNLVPLTSLQASIQTWKVI